MPDLTVKQALTPQMEQTPTRQTSLLDAYKPSGKVVPSYLVILEPIEKNKNNYFVAIKFDDAHVHYGKFVGFYYTGTLDKLFASYDEIIGTTDASYFVEIHFPWSKIQSIRSLIYKHKVTGEKK